MLPRKSATIEEHDKSKMYR